LVHKDYGFQFQGKVTRYTRWFQAAGSKFPCA